MAKTPKGIFGPFSGKIGPVIGSSWKGIPYIKQSPDPDTPKEFSKAQIAQQQKFKFAGNFTDILQPFLEIGFANEAVRKTAKNAAFSCLFHNAVTGVYPNLGINYSQVLISKGAMPGLSAPVAKRSGDGTVQLNWSPSGSALARFDDQIMLVLYCPAVLLADGFMGGAIRVTGNAASSTTPKCEVTWPIFTSGCTVRTARKYRIVSIWKH